MFRAYGRDENYRQTINTTTMTHVVAVPLDDERGARSFRRPAEFWRWLEQYPSVLLVAVGADRELAMVGHEPPGDGWELRYPPLHNDPNRPRFYWAEWRRKNRKHCHVDIMQLGNLHHEGVYAAELSLVDAVAWMRDWVWLVRANELGPKIEWTLARQALQSYRREADQHSRRLRWHNCRGLHRFEREVYNVQSPVRIAPEDGKYEEVYHLDFVAHYVSILAQEPMPQECLAWLPEGHPADQLHSCTHLLFLADVTLRDGTRRLVVTPQVERTDVVEVHRAAYYRPGTMLQPWARRMFALRESAPEHVRKSVKGLAVSLWGRLCQRNHGFALDPAHEYQPGEEALYGLGNIPNHDTGGMERYTAEGERWVADPDAWRRERFPALGAHVLAHGRLLMEGLMSGVEPLYCHTDSIWSLAPVPWVSEGGLWGIGADLGQVTQEVVRNVEWRDGVRYVGGEIDAQPGVARVGSRFYHPYDDPELLALPQTAAWEERQ